VPQSGPGSKAPDGGHGAKDPEAESILKCRRLIFALKLCAYGKDQPCRNYSDEKFHEFFWREIFHEIFREICLKYFRNFTTRL